MKSLWSGNFIDVQEIKLQGKREIDMKREGIIIFGRCHISQFNAIK